MEWLKTLFSRWDRQTAAADRAAVALENIADDLELVRDQLRARLNGTEAAPAIEDRGEPSRNGRKRLAATGAN